MSLKINENNWWPKVEKRQKLISNPKPVSTKTSIKTSTSMPSQNTRFNCQNRCTLFYKETVNICASSKSLHPSYRKESVSIQIYTKYLPTTICQNRCTLLQKQEAVSIQIYRKTPATVCQNHCTLL
jgi:hypothetical protein